MLFNYIYKFSTILDSEQSVEVICFRIIYVSYILKNFKLHIALEN